MTDYSLVLPVRDAVTDPWFAALDDGRLLIQRDPETGTPFFYPRARVPGHPDREPEWMEASGRGTLYSFTVVERSVHAEFQDLTPFTLAIVTLEEGPRMTAWLVDVPYERIVCDMALKLVIREILPGLKMPCFTEA